MAFRKLFVSPVDHAYEVVITTRASARSNSTLNPLMRNSLAKRGMDLIGGLTGLILLAPLMLVIALVVWIETGSVLFKQRRTGFEGRIFSIYKFRTMRVSEDCKKVMQVSKGDTRLTRSGAFLRALSLDELPQLINVMKGDMSIVGPRPHAVAHDLMFGTIEPRYGSRHLVRPGLTGLAQINGARGEIRTNADLSRRVTLDLQYIEQFSLSLDLKIIGQTVSRIWRDKQAY